MPRPRGSGFVQRLKVLTAVQDSYRGLRWLQRFEVPAAGQDHAVVRDLTAVRDLAAGQDLAVVQDLTAVPDLTAGQDLAAVQDLTAA